MKLIRFILEYLGILKVTIDIGNDEIRIIESVKFLFFFKIISVKSEKLYDSSRFSFILERFLEKNTSHKIKRVYLTLSSTSIIPLFLSFPGIPKDKIESAILWEIERSIPLPIEEAYYTYKIVSKVNDGGKTVWNVIAVIAKKDEVDKHISTLNDLNINVEEVSYLPINILSALAIANSENAIGYVYISNHSIELYIMLKKQIINFAHHIGDFNDITPVTMRNIVDYFAGFIKKRISFLERITVISRNAPIGQEIAESLFDSLNIFSLPATEDDFLPLIHSVHLDLVYYDLVGFSYKSFINFNLSSKQTRKLHQHNVILRTSIIIFFILDIITLSTFPLIITGMKQHDTIKRAKNVPIEELTDPEVRKMAQTIQNIEKIELYKKKEKDLKNKISEIKSSGIRPSNVKVVLADICRLIPEDVWLKDVKLNNLQGEMTGYSTSSTGLERYVKYLVNSRVLVDVVLKSAQLKNSRGKSLLLFSITFGVKR